MSLRLTHLKVAQLRRFREPFELTGLQPGLNLFAGPNEAGKSTLVRAIRAAFFERYRSKAVDDLRPWGDSGATPSVEIAFELNGQAGLLNKSFLGSKARCDLRMGSQTWSGNDAEDHLAQLMGFAYAGKGASKPEHWGIPGLLWVEQGSGQWLQEAAGHAHGHLHQALQSHLQTHAHAHAQSQVQVQVQQASALTATCGDAVLSAISAQRDLLLTATGKPKGPLADAIQRVDALHARCQELQAKVQAYRQQVDDLSRLRADRARDEATRPWEQLQHQLDKARHLLQQAEQARLQLADARQHQTQYEARQALLLQQLEQFEQQARECSLRQQAAKQARQRLQDAEARLLQTQQQAAQANEALTQAQALLRAAQQADQRQKLLQQRASQGQALAAAQSALEQAQRADVELQAARQRAQGPQLALADLQRVRQLDREAHQARLRMQDLATRVHFKLQPGQSIGLSSAGLPDVDALIGEGERLLLGLTTLSLPGLGELRIQPGGDDLGQMASRLQAAEQALLVALTAWDVSDLSEAERAFERQAELAQGVKLATQALTLLAPQGVNAHSERVAQAQQDLRHTEEALQRLPAADLDLQQALSLAAAEAALRAAEQAHEQASQAWHQAQTMRATASAQAEAADREWQALHAQSEAPQRQAQREAAQAQWLDVKAEGQAQAQRVAQLQAQLELARPDILTQDVTRFERSLAQALQAQQQRALQITLLEQSLALEGAQGLEEALALSLGEFSRAQSRQAELQLRADALELLRAKLQAKRQAALNRLQAPLQAHLQRYLSLLFPGASVAVSDTLVPTELTRRSADGGQEVGAFESLSFGAREQLAMVSRFAYADLLREAGRPTLIMLDDALVHSDTERLAMMKRVVFDASHRHQVLLFTCHPESWADMGVEARRIS